MNKKNNLDSLISTNTIFHFTRTIDNLESILKNDFYPQFSFDNILGTILNAPDGERAIPMVCFCDIPLAQIRKHTNTYGDYALGLSKKWAIKNKINPVSYTYSNSDFSNKIKHAILKLDEHEKEVLKSDSTLGIQFDFAIQYIKPYEGKLWKNGKWSKENIRFYDEREWRYIPNFKNIDQPLWISNEVLKEPHPLEDLNKTIAERKDVRLSFVPNDIKFIIVKKESEILPMLDKVINIKKHKFLYNDVQLLTTRIISMESIRENF